MESKWLKIKSFWVGPEHNEKGQLIKNVFLNAVPVARFNFERDPELKEKKEELSQRKREGRFIEALKQGVQSPFSGELMHNLFLQEIGFEELVSRYPVGVGATHQPVDILGTTFHSINLGYPSIEFLKLYNSSDLGALMGQTRAPNKETLRNHLANLGSQGKSAELIRRCFSLMAIFFPIMACMWLPKGTIRCAEWP